MKISKKRILALALAITTTTTQMSIANAEAPTPPAIAMEAANLKQELNSAIEVVGRLQKDPEDIGDTCIVTASVADASRDYPCLTATGKFTADFYQFLAAAKALRGAVLWAGADDAAGFAEAKNELHRATSAFKEYAEAKGVAFVPPTDDKLTTQTLAIAAKALPFPAPDLAKEAANAALENWRKAAMGQLAKHEAPELAEYAAVEAAMKRMRLFVKEQEAAGRQTVQAVTAFVLENPCDDAALLAAFAVIGANPIMKRVPENLIMLQLNAVYGALGAYVYGREGRYDPEGMEKVRTLIGRLLERAGSEDLVALLAAWFRQLGVPGSLLAGEGGTEALTPLMNALRD
ncbi:MAG: hypothetical protein LBJ38_02340 [Oscillospiraceae bacterium]|jgi:hypothetical protein|nr:hypothetical protein [Oscillospiraceae bacterium]